MKKILYFVPEFPRLTETFIEREISKLAQRGNVEVEVLSLQKGTGYLSPNLEKAVHYERLALMDCVLSLPYVFKFGKLIEIFVRTKVHSKRGCLKNWYLVLKSIGYINLFKNFKPDHIHVHFLSDPSTMVMTISALTGIPYSISGHARDVFVDGTLIPQKVQSAKFISICNNYAWNKCVQLAQGVNTANIHRIYHGMDLSKYLEATPAKSKPQRPMIFIGSRLVEKKGLAYALRASRILLDRGINHELHIVGPGVMYEKLVALKLELGLNDHVFIPGEGKGVSNAEVMEYFKIADVFAHPSIETGEGDVDGVPTYVIESAMMKVPVVATEAGSITDLIDNSTGILVPQKDAVALANGIERLLFDKNLASSLKENAYNRAKDMFDLDRNVSTLEGLLLE